MILGHVMGLPIEESVVQLATAGATVTVVAVAGRSTLGRLLGRLRKR